MNPGIVPGNTPHGPEGNRGKGNVRISPRMLGDFLLVEVGSLAILAHVYQVAIGIADERMETRYIDECKQDSAGLVFHWTMDEVNGNRVADESGHGVNGVMGSLFENHRLFFRIPGRFCAFALPKSIKGAVGKALEFNGRNWIQAGNTRCYTTDRFTISAWIWKKKERPAVQGDWFVPTIAAKSDWPGNGWWLCTQPNTQYLDMAISTGPARRHIHSEWEIPAEEWHHVLVTMDNAGHEIRFFVDGKQFGKTHVDVPAWEVNWDQYLFVGDYDGTGRWPWIGRIDDFYYWNKLLSEEEIASHYATESAARARDGISL